MIIKGVCKCDTDLKQQFIKQEVNIKWLTWSDYNIIAWFCSISSTKIVSNKVTAIAIQTQRCFVYEWTAFLNESSESVIQLLRSWMNQSFERINWMNDSVIKSVTCRHLLAVLVSFLKHLVLFKSFNISIFKMLYLKHEFMSLIALMPPLSLIKRLKIHIQGTLCSSVPPL